MTKQTVMLLMAVWFAFGIMALIAITFNRRNRKLDRMIKKLRSDDP